MLRFRETELEAAIEWEDAPISRVFVAALDRRRCKKLTRVAG